MIPTFLVIGFASLWLLHLFEPALAKTWSYGHLGRHPWLPWTAATLSLAIVLGARLAWRHPASRSPLAPGSLARALLAFGLLLLVLLVLAIFAPAPAASPDVDIFRKLVLNGGYIARWHLLQMVYQAVAGSWSDPESVVLAVCVTNAFFGALALFALMGSARILAQTRGEAFALTALVWTAFGTLQLAVGYPDVYPMPLALAALYCWLSLESIAGDLHPAWPVALAAIGSFVYVGLVLLVPSASIVLACALRRPGGGRRVAIAVAAALAAAGVATLPVFGAPFAWQAWVGAMMEAPAAQMGSNPEGYHLPVSQLFHAYHLADVLHIAMLVDPVGWLLVLVAGIWAVSLGSSSGSLRELSFLALLVLPYLIFVLVMEPLWGAYVDWDLYSYGAVATSLFGGLAFVLWGRLHPRAFGWLLGLALAVSSVHLMARLDSMDVEKNRHVRESPPTYMGPIHRAGSG